MSDQTTNWDIPYPELTDGVANIEEAVKPTAERIETILNALFGTGGPSDLAAVRDALGVAIGDDVQAHDATLDAIAALTTTPFGLSLLTEADAAAVLALLGADASTATRTPTDGSVTVAKTGTGDNGLARGAFSVYRSTTLNAATGDQVVMNAEEFDISGWHDTTTGRFTPQLAGIYRLSWRIATTGPLAVDTYLSSRLLKNGATAKDGSISDQRGASPISSEGSALVEANGSTDYFTLLMLTNSAGTQGIGTGAAVTYFQGELVGRS